MGIVIHAGRVGKCVEEKYIGRSGEGVIRLQNSKRIFDRY